MSTREPMIHELKCWPEPYRAVKSGAKPFEWRKDDRDYRVGDTIWLREWVPVMGWEADEGCEPRFTGDECRRTVTYIIREGFGIPPGYCIMGLSELEAHPPAREVVEAAQYAMGFADSYQSHGHDERYRKEASQVYSKLQKALSAQPKEVAPTVDQIMEVVKEWRREAGAFGSNDNRELDKLRARLKTHFP